MPRPPRNGFGFPWSREDACPCGSRRAFGECCLSAAGRPSVAIASLLPPGRVTGFAHPRCYLRVSGNCSQQISREHYISRGLLMGPEMQVRGMPWHREEVFTGSPDNLTAKILCRRHNSALSPLDDHALRFYEALGDAVGHVSRRSLSRRTRHYIVSGDALELWAMKTLAGLYASGIEFTVGEHRFRDYPPPMERLACTLTAASPVSLMTLALSSDLEEHEPSLGRRAVSIGPIIDEEERELMGLLIRMHGIGLRFHIDLQEGPGIVPGEGVQPDMIDLNGPDRSARIYLSWKRSRHSGLIVEIATGRPRAG